MVVDAVSCLDAETLDLKGIGLKKVRCCSLARHSAGVLGMTMQCIPGSWLLWLHYIASPPCTASPWTRGGAVWWRWLQHGALLLLLTDT